MGYSTRPFSLTAQTSVFHFGTMVKHLPHNISITSSSLDSVAKVKISEAPI